MYWHDPRMIGLDYIPDGLWRPADCYIGNQHGNMERIRHENRPVLIDKKTGLLLWPVEFVGLLSNPMALHKFPFDTDAIDILIHQNEASLGRDEYIFRPWPPAEEAQSVRFFFGVHDDLTEFDVVVQQGGGELADPTEFSKAHHLHRAALAVLLAAPHALPPAHRPARPRLSVRNRRGSVGRSRCRSSSAHILLALFFLVNIETFSRRPTTPRRRSSPTRAWTRSERNNVAVTMFSALRRCSTSSRRRCRRRRT